MHRKQRELIVRSALRGLRIVSLDELQAGERDEPLPDWPGKVELMNARQVEYHASRN